MKPNKKLKFLKFLKKAETNLKYEATDLKYWESSQKYWEIPRKYFVEISGNGSKILVK